MTQLVSVLIPTHNRCTQVLEAIDSVRAQTHHEFEIIVVDDGSTDDTPASVAKQDGVVYLRQERSGPASARTRALAAARGDYVALLDSDDVWQPEFLERSLAVIDEHDLDLAFSNWRRNGGEISYLELLHARGRLQPFMERPWREWFLLEPQVLRRLVVALCPAPSSSLVLRRASMPQRWNPRMQIADDWYLLLEMCLRQRRRAAFTMEPLWTKRLAGENRYDGRPAAEALRELHVHDLGQFRRDFRDVLTLRERVTWAERMWRYRAFLVYLRLRGRDRDSAAH